MVQGVFRVSRYLGVIACCALGFATIVATGGGGGGGAPTVPTVSANGIWDGTFAEVGVGTFDTTALLYNGRIIAISETANAIFDGSYTVSGNTLSGNVSAYVIGGGIFATTTLSGTFSEQTSLTGTFSTSYGTTGTFSMAFNDIYDRNSSLSLVEGAWRYTDFTYTLDLTVNSDGSIFGQDSEGCVFGGNISILDPAHNLYDIELNVGACGIFDGNYDGFAGLFDIVTTNDTLQTAVSNPNFIWLLPFSRQ